MDIGPNELVYGGLAAVFLGAVVTGPAAIAAGASAAFNSVAAVLGGIFGFFLADPFAEATGLNMEKKASPAPEG